jgi:hypothetical protein
MDNRQEIEQQRDDTGVVSQAKLQMVWWRDSPYEVRVCRGYNKDMEDTFFELKYPLSDALIIRTFEYYQASLDAVSRPQFSSLFSLQMVI